MSKSFADLGISDALCRVLERQGATTPFPIQSMVAPDILAGRDVLAKSPTGSGKTVAFAAPIIERLTSDQRRPAALILAPTRELVVQIVEQTRPLAEARGLKTLAVYGGVGIQPQIQKARKAHVLVACPGRLLDLLDRGALTLENVRTVVLDEADRMLDMGFRPDVERILRQTPRDRQTLLFSATLDGEVGKLARAYTTEPTRHDNAPAESERPQIEHRFVDVEHSEKVSALASELGSRENGLALVFVRTRRGADRLVKRLSAKGVRSAAMHGGKSQGNRQRTLGEFERGKVDALIATDVAARGIDVAGITHVINYDPPEDREGYVHRVGRTARAGAHGVGITFVIPDQRRDVAKIAAELDLRDELAQAGLGAHKPSANKHSERAPARSHRPSKGNGRRNQHNRQRSRSANR